MTEKFIGKLKTAGKVEKGPAAKTFVEIGLYQGATIPYIGNGRFKKGKNDNNLYIGIDLRSDRVRDAKEDAESMRVDIHKKDNMLFIHGDARKLPLKTESADEIFMGNVLGDLSISGSDKEAMLKEARRGIKSGGRLIIREIYTPLRLKSVEELCRKAGFMVEKVITGKNEEEITELKRFNRFERGDLYGYALYAEPDEKWSPRGEETGEDAILK